MERNEAEKILNNAMHPEESVRVESEGKMKMLLNSNYPCFLRILGDIMTDNNVGYSLRVMASIIIKNGLHSKNKRIQNDFMIKWRDELSDSIRSIFIELMKQNLGIEEKFILENVTKILGSIMRIEIEIGLNNTHFQWILQQLEEGHHVVSILKILSVVSNQLYDETNYSFKDNGNIGYIYKAAVHYLDIEFGDSELHKEVLLCVWNTMDIFVDIFQDNVERERFLKRLGGFVGLDNELAESGMETLNKFVSLNHNLIVNELSTIAQFYDKILLNDNEGLAIQAMDFWEILAEKKSYNRLFEKHTDVLLNQMFRRLKKEELDDVETSEHKAACSILILLREINGPRLLQNIISRDFISTRLTSNDPEQRAIGAIALACIFAKGGADESFAELFMTILINGLLSIEQMVDSVNMSVTFKQDEINRSIKSIDFEIYIHEFFFCLGNICERDYDIIAPKLSKIIECCGKIIYGSTNQIAASAAWTYSSLFHNIKYTSIFNEILYTAYKDIILLLVNKLEIIDVANYDLRNALISALSGLILCYTSKLLPVFNDFVVYLLQKLSQFVTVAVTSENIFILEDLLSNYLPIFVLVLERPVICNSIEIFTLFTAILRMPETKAHGEVFIAISILTTRIIEYLPQLLPSILIGIRSHDPFIMKAALNAMADCATCLEDRFDPYISSVIGTFIEAIAADSTALENKSFIIDNLADISLAVGHKFQPYLEMAIVLLRQVVQLDRRGDEEFVDNLRKSVIRFFNYIVISLGNSNELRKQLPTIFNFIQQAHQLDVDHSYIIECIDFLLDIKNIFGHGVIPRKWVFELSKINNHSEPVLKKISILLNEFK